MVEKATLEKYRDNGHTLADTATALGITYNSAQHYCKKHGVTFRGNYKPPKTEMTERQPAGERRKILSERNHKD